MATMFPTQLFGVNGLPMTGTSTTISEVIDVRNSYAMAIQLYWSGTPTGTFSIQGSMNYNLSTLGSNVLNAGTWDDMGITTANSPAGSAGHTLIDITATGISWIRVVYTNSSGSGTLTGMAQTKG